MTKTLKLIFGRRPQIFSIFSLNISFSQVKSKLHTKNQFPRWSRIFFTERQTDQPTDRPTKQPIEAPSWSLKIHSEILIQFVIQFQILKIVMADRRVFLLGHSVGRNCHQCFLGMRSSDYSTNFVADIKIKTLQVVHVIM